MDDAAEAAAAERNPTQIEMVNVTDPAFNHVSFDPP